MENDAPNKEKNWLLPASILTAAVIIAGSVIYSTGLKNYESQKADLAESANNQAAQKVEISSSDVVLGNPGAPVTIIEFGDYQCPFCAKFFHDTEWQIIDKYVNTGKAKIVYKGLAFLGSESESAVLAASCAKEQGKFWQMHDAIFEAEWSEVKNVIAGKMQSNENNGNLTREFFAKTAQGLRINKDSFLSCFDSKKYKTEIDDNSKQASAALNGKVSTPSFLINGKVIQGALPFEDFSKTIDEILSKK